MQTPKLGRCLRPLLTLSFKTKQSLFYLVIMDGVLANILCGISMLCSILLDGLLSSFVPLFIRISVRVPWFVLLFGVDVWLFVVDIGDLDGVV